MSGWRPSMILVWKPSRTKRQCEQWQKVDLRLFGTDPQFKIKRQTSSCEMSIWWDSINTTHIHPLHFQFFNTTAIPDRWTRAHLHLQMEVGHGRNHPGDCEDWHASYAWCGNLYLERFAQGYGGIRYHWYHNQQSWIGSAIGGAVQRWCLIPFSLWLTTDWLIFFGKAWEACNIWATTLLALLDGWNSNILEHLRWLRVLDPAETYGNFFLLDNSEYKWFEMDGHGFSLPGGSNLAKLFGSHTSTVCHSEVCCLGTLYQTVCHSTGLS